MRGRLRPPQCLQLGESLRLPGGQIVVLTEVGRQVVELPDVVVERAARPVIGNGLVPVVPDPPVAEHLEVLGRLAGDGVRVGERRREAHALHTRVGVELQHLQQGRREIGDMAELVTQTGGAPTETRCAHDQRVADPPAVGVLLVALERSVRCHRPTVREVRMRVRAADVVDPGDLVGHRLGDHVERPHRVDEPERATLLAGSVVGQHDHDGVVECAGRLDERDQAAEVLVEVLEHRRVRAGQPGEESLLVRVVLVPRLHPGVSRREFGAAGDDPHLDLAGQSLVAGPVPALLEHRGVLVDQLARRLVRCVACSRRHREEPWGVGDRGMMACEVADRLVDQIRGQVIAGRVVARCADVGVVADEFGGVLVGFGIEEPVVPIEATPERPPVERPGRTRLGESGDVPLPDEVVAVPVWPEDLGDRRNVGCDLAAVAGEAAVEVGEASHSDRVMVAAGEQCGAGGGAHRGRVEAGVAQAVGSEAIDGRGVDLRAVAAEVGEPDVVEHDEQHVGPSCRCSRIRRPPRRRLADRGPDGPAERLSTHRTKLTGAIGMLTTMSPTPRTRPRSRPRAACSFSRRSVSRPRAACARSAGVRSAGAQPAFGQRKACSSGWAAGVVVGATE